MFKRERYREILRTLSDWEPFLVDESGLPGPRATLELAQAVADEGEEELFRRLLSYGPAVAGGNTPSVFLACCGVVGLGRLLADGRTDLLADLRACASDPRWRIREAVAMALQRYGMKDIPGLLGAMQEWVRGTPLEQRAAVAALCEPALLIEPAHVEKVLAILEDITRQLVHLGPAERQCAGFLALRKGMGYCWSVAVAAHPEKGKLAMESWLTSQDRDVRWIMRENLKRTRLPRVDGDWVARCRERLAVV